MTCFFKQLFPFQSTPISHITQSKDPIQKQHIFSVNGWTGLKPCYCFLVFPVCFYEIPDDLYFM